MPGLQDVSFNSQSADRIGAIERDEPLAEFARGPHRQGHRINERVDARAHVLKIEDQCIYVAQHLLSRLTKLAVKRMSHNARARVAEALPFNHIVLRLASDSMLRPEKSRQINAGMAVKQVCGVPEIVIYRSRVANQSDARSADQRVFFRQQSLQSERDLVLHKAEYPTMRKPLSTDGVLSPSTHLGYNPPTYFPAFITIPALNPATIPIIPIVKAPPSVSPMR